MRHSVSVAARTPALVAAALIYKSMGPVFTKQSQRAKILIKQHVMCEGGFTQESSKEAGRALWARPNPLAPPRWVS
jgi:hypothetical protein